MKEAHGWTALQVSAYLTIFNFPWIIKPIYGAFSDFVPLFGYRRKPYLLGANVVAAGAFFWVTQLTAPDRLFWTLELTAYAMAISSTVCGAVLVENGQRLGESGRFVNQQWLWFNAATMVASIVGGELTQRLSPTAALHIAAAIVAVAPLAVLFGTIFLIPDKKTPIDLPALRATFGSLVTAFKRRELWIVGLFLFLYYFNPGLSTPLYYYMTDDLKFSQSYIVIGTAVAALVASIAAPSDRAIAQTLEASPVFEGAITAPTKDGATQPAKISVQSWELSNQEGAAQEIPLRGFYVAHLLSGDIATTVDGQTAERVPDAYWTVKEGATMQVKVLSELAVLETIAATKP